MILRCAIIDME